MATPIYDSDDPWSHPSAPSAPSETFSTSWAIPSDPPTPSLAASTVPRDIESWNTAALASLSLSESASVHPAPVEVPRSLAAQRAAVRLLPVRGPVKKEALTRREISGNNPDSSRARRRRENDLLHGVPNLTPPTPEDLLPKPTHPIITPQYHLAPTWDTLRSSASATASATALHRKTTELRTGLATGTGKGAIPRDLREQAKRSALVRGLTREIEGRIRSFMEGVVAKWESIEGLEETDLETDVEEEWVRVSKGDGGEKDRPTVLFEPEGPSEQAALRRWIIHVIAGYYGLVSTSMTLPEPERRVVIVGVTEEAVTGTGKEKIRKRKDKNHARLGRLEIPRPLWEVVC